MLFLLSLTCYSCLYYSSMIRLKETDIADQNLRFSAADLCTDFRKQFEKLLMQKDFIVLVMLVL